MSLKNHSEEEQNAIMAKALQALIDGEYYSDGPVGVDSSEISATALEALADAVETHEDKGLLAEESCGGMGSFTGQSTHSKPLRTAADISEEKRVVSATPKSYPKQYHGHPGQGSYQGSSYQGGTNPSAGYSTPRRPTYQQGSSYGGHFSGGSTYKPYTPPPPPPPVNAPKRGGGLVLIDAGDRVDVYYGQSKGFSKKEAEDVLVTAVKTTGDDEEIVEITYEVNEDADSGVRAGKVTAELREFAYEGWHRTVVKKTLDDV